MIFGGVGERSKIGYFFVREYADQFKDARLGVVETARFRSRSKIAVTVTVVFCLVCGGEFV